MKSASLTAALMAFLFSGCAAGPAGDTPAVSAAGVEPRSAARTDLSLSLVDSLRRAGLTVRDTGAVDQPFFSVPAHVYQVEGRDLQVYEFPSAVEAQAAATQVSPTGSPIGTSMVTWMAAPHFFLKDQIVVNYIGTSEKVLAELQQLLGPQFAGR